MGATTVSVLPPVAEEAEDRFGGGGGGAGSGGGGGSSAAAVSARNVTTTSGDRAGNGQVIISILIPRSETDDRMKLSPEIFRVLGLCTQRPDAPVVAARLPAALASVVPFPDPADVTVDDGLEPLLSAHLRSVGFEGASGVLDRLAGARAAARPRR